MTAHADRNLLQATKTEYVLGEMARATGLEPATSGVTGRHSNQLSYARAGLRGHRPQRGWDYGAGPKVSSAKRVQIDFPRHSFSAHRRRPASTLRQHDIHSCGPRPQGGRHLRSMLLGLTRSAVRAVSSVGRASPLHGEGRRFEPVTAHQPSRSWQAHGFPVSFERALQEPSPALRTNGSIKAVVPRRIGIPQPDLLSELRRAFPRGMRTPKQPSRSPLEAARQGRCQACHRPRCDFSRTSWPNTPACRPAGGVCPRCRKP
jgi:hypothetical protein